jgi:histidine triad (HIT) family protein
MASEEAAIQEKLKNMSPEELKQFQVQNCIFCHIVKGRVASKKIYEDDKCLAILDINPANPGHILLMPKEHYSIMPLIPEDVIQHLFMISKQLSAALLRMLNKDSQKTSPEDIGTNIFVANGAAAGQKAQHFMVHIIPRMQKDGVNLELETKEINEKESESLRKILATKLAKDFGVKVIEVSETKRVSDDAQKSLISDKPKLEAKSPIEEKVEEVKIEKPKIVEAEFKDKKSAKKDKHSKPKKEKKAKPEESVSLDDIANLITGRK